eukprot:589915-Amphidinium_carterae.1
MDSQVLQAVWKWSGRILRSTCAYPNVILNHQSMDQPELYCCFRYHRKHGNIWRGETSIQEYALSRQGWHNWLAKTTKRVVWTNRVAWSDTVPS